MAGVFDKFDNSKKIGSNRHKPGRYYSRIDKVEDSTTQDGRPMLKISMTVAKLTEERGEEGHAPDDATSLVFTRDRYGYFERDVRALLKATLDLTFDEANGYSGEEMAKALLIDKAITNMLVEVDAKRLPKKGDDGETFVKTRIVRSLGEAEAQRVLGDDYARFFPQGITALQPVAAGVGPTKKKGK